MKKSINMTSTINQSAIQEEEAANSKVDQDPEQVGENEMGDLKETK